MDRVQSPGYKTLCRTKGRYKVLDTDSMVQVHRMQSPGSDFRVQSPGCRVQDAESRVQQGVESRMQSPGYSRV